MSFWPATLSRASRHWTIGSRPTERGHSCPHGRRFVVRKHLGYPRSSRRRNRRWGQECPRSDPHPQPTRPRTAPCPIQRLGVSDLSGHDGRILDPALSVPHPPLTCSPKCSTLFRRLKGKFRFPSTNSTSSPKSKTVTISSPKSTGAFIAAKDLSARGTI